MMLGLLLARAGFKVVVLEKHRDFLRDFRGDTIHPSTLELLHELGLLEEFLRLPHQKVHELQAQFGDLRLPSPISAACRCAARTLRCSRNGTFSTSSPGTAGPTRGSR